MKIFKYDEKTGISCGINDFGELFFDNGASGYNLPDCQENRDYILADFDYYTRPPRDIDMARDYYDGGYGDF